jgi:hypothetical protein
MARVRAHRSDKAATRSAPRRARAIGKRVAPGGDLDHLDDATLAQALRAGDLRVPGALRRRFGATVDRILRLTLGPARARTIADETTRGDDDDRQTLRAFRDLLLQATPEDRAALVVRLIETLEDDLGIPPGSGLLPPRSTTVTDGLSDDARLRPRSGRGDN